MPVGVEASRGQQAEMQGTASRARTCYTTQVRCTCYIAQVRRTCYTAQVRRTCYTARGGQRTALGEATM